MASMGFNDQSEWWRHAVFYQVYVRSFADSDGDGIGDLPGITSRLPYLRDLGVDALWITPVLHLAAARPRLRRRRLPRRRPALRHPRRRRRAARARPRAGPEGDRRPRAQPHLERARVVPGRPGRRSGQHGARARTSSATAAGRRRAPPNNWSSVFGGPAWTRGRRTASGTSTSSTPTQPDLNWRNPEVGDMFDDVLTLLARPRGRRLPGRRRARPVQGGRAARPGGRRAGTASSVPTESTAGASMVERTMRDEPMWDQPEVHDVYRRWHDVLASTTATGCWSPRRGRSRPSRWPASSAPTR